MTKLLQGVAIREFARREGVSDTLVHRALKQGRLTAFADRSIDPTLVGSAWRKGNLSGEPGTDKAANRPDIDANSLQMAGSAKGLSYGEAQRLKENWLALLRRLEYEEKSGTLIELAVAQNVVFELCRQQRDAWLTWPAKVAPFIARQFAIDNLDQLTTILAAHVHQQLAELGEPEAPFDPGEGFAQQ